MKAIDREFLENSGLFFTKDTMSHEALLETAGDPSQRNAIKLSYYSGYAQYSNKIDFYQNLDGKYVTSFFNFFEALSKNPSMMKADSRIKGFILFHEGYKSATEDFIKAMNRSDYISEHEEENFEFIPMDNCEFLNTKNVKDVLQTDA